MPNQPHRQPHPVTHPQQPRGGSARPRRAVVDTRRTVKQLRRTTRLTQPIVKGNLPTGPTSGAKFPRGKAGQPGALQWFGLASQYGAQANVDPKVILALIQAESGGNPQAVGDAGHSVGLFQLHDHGAGAGLSVADRMNPIVQFNRFFPTIANAYHAGLSLGLSGTELADYTGMHAERPAASGKGRYGAAYDNLVGFLGAGNNGVTNGATLPPQLNLNSPTGGATPTTIIPAQTGGIITAPTSGTPVSTSTTAPAGGGAAGTTTGTSGQKIPKTAPGSVGRFVDVITGKYKAGEGSNQIISSFLDKNGKPILINGVVLIVGVLIVLISIGALVFKGGAKLEEKTGLISKGAKAALAAAV